MFMRLSGICVYKHEATAGLDPKERIVFRNLIASLAGECTILLSTHIVSDIESIADDVLVMKEGCIFAHDTCETLLKSMQGKVWEVSFPVPALLPISMGYNI